MIPPEAAAAARRSDDTAWPRNGIDFWILARLEQEGLKPSPEADRYTLLRRASLDLRGLPPTPEEVDRFVRDQAPDAYERAVDRFLDDPAYGERWARMWLDLARYADSAGYGSDPLAAQHLALSRLGHRRLQPQPALRPVHARADRRRPAARTRASSDRIATAFHRNTMTNTEGGTDDEEFRVAAIKDRVDTTMQVWMGLTMGCAKCHSHKYDPITQEEYYRFYAIFNQTADNDQPDESPVIPAPTRSAGRARRSTRRSPSCGEARRAGAGRRAGQVGASLARRRGRTEGCAEGVLAISTRRPTSGPSPAEALARISARSRRS